MKTSQQNILNPAAASLNVLVVYEDVCSGIETKDLCDRLARKLEPPGELKASFWSLAALEFPDLAQMAADEAIQADLLIIAVNGSGWLRPSIKIWFSQWARRTANHAGAMVAQLRGILGTDSDLSPAYECLKKIAESAGVDFFSEVVELTRENPDRVVESIHPRACMALPLLDALQLPGNENTQG
jgi:hypothetical protein